MLRSAQRSGAAGVSPLARIRGVPNTVCSTAQICTVPYAGNSLRALARFCDACGSPINSRHAALERKQVTILFADVVESMRLAATLESAMRRQFSPTAGSGHLTVAPGRGIGSQPNRPSPGLPVLANSPLVSLARMSDRVALRAGIPPFYVMDVWLAAAERQRTRGDLVNLSAGQPSAGAPAAVRAAAKDALDNTVLGYTVALGIPE